MKKTFYRYPLGWVFSDIGNLIYGLIAATDFKVLIVVGIIPAKI